MSKSVRGGGGFFGGRREVTGGRAGRGPGRGTSRSTTGPWLFGKGPTTGHGPKGGPAGKGPGKSKGL
jgi:hypothetical protein